MIPQSENMFNPTFVDKLEFVAGNSVATLGGVVLSHGIIEGFTKPEMHGAASSLFIGTSALIGGIAFAHFDQVRDKTRQLAAGVINRILYQ